MWPKGLKSYSSILEIKDYAKINKSAHNQTEIRSSVKIVIIDDEKFQAYQNLASYGYKITELPDIRTIAEIKAYDVVLCDLMGVGNNFDKSIGGGSIIREIKNNYPTKFVIAYTGARANTSEANAAREFADDFLKKDAEISKLVEKLDNAIDVATDPYGRWLNARQGLIDAEIDIRKIVELESAYVLSIRNKDRELSALTNISKRMDLGGHARSIIDGLVSSAIYSWLF